MDWCSFILHMQISKTEVVDPEHLGGILGRVNSAHGTSANTILVPSKTGRFPRMCGTRASLPGEEMAWDYGAYTDDTEDPQVVFVSRSLFLQKPQNPNL